MTENTDFHHRLLTGLIRLLESRGEAVTRIETHISSVLLCGNRAYKIKKPLDLGFLDFSTLARRRFCCEEEVRLNRRLAPDIYLGVVAVTGTPEHPQLGGEGKPIEYAVEMRRFSQAGLLSDASEALTPELADAIADRLAAFHAGIERAGPDQPYGDPQRVLFPMTQNFDQIRDLTGGAAARPLQQLEAWTRQQYQALESTLRRRKAEGFIRECHGDLHLGNIAVDEGTLIIFDGIEFNPDLRWIDTMNELAFLLMDLDGRGHPGLAQRVLNRYLEQSGDYAGVALIRFYQVYRAMVRAKVAAIRLRQPGLDAAAGAALEQEFSGYLEQAAGYTRPRPQALLLTHGPSGSGKSTVTGALLERLPGVIRLRSDVERKRLAGMTAAAASGSGLESGIYTPAFSRRTYRRLLDLSAALLEAGFSPLVDATFLKQAQRRPFLDLAEQRGVPWLILDFQVPLAELRRRVSGRKARGGDVSEADLAVLERQIEGSEPLDDREQARVLTWTPEQPVAAERVRECLWPGA